MLSKWAVRSGRPVGAGRHVGHVKTSGPLTAYDTAYEESKRTGVAVVLCNGKVDTVYINGAEMTGRNPA